MIPDKAYGAAGEAVAHYSATVDTPQLSQVITEAIQAAAPFIRAEALRDEAKRIHRNGLGKPTNDEWFAGQWAMDYLARRADILDPS